MKIFSCVMLLFLLIRIECFAQDKNKPTLRFVFYNVENFFDTYDDTLTNDNEFLPGGLMRWNQKRYSEKIHAIYKVLAATGEWESPAVVGFCEVEKKSVLLDLINNTYLQKFNYGIIHEESDDLRGIDVCLIYRKDLVKILDYKYFKPQTIPKTDFRTRSVLYSELLVSNDTIHLLLNHWPSRRGGALAEESLRTAISSMVRFKADSISALFNSKAKIIIAGDFNCTPGDQEIANLINISQKEYIGVQNRLYNLSESAANKGLGTYKYRGAWEMIDQVIVSDWLINCNTGYSTNSSFFRIFNSSFLLKPDPSYPGSIPFSTYRGYRYQGGFSDHLPVILDLK